MRCRLVLAWLALGLSLVLAHAPAAAAPSERTPETKKRLIGTSELVQAARNRRVITNCRVDGKKLDLAILQLIRDGSRPKLQGGESRLLLGLSNCVIYPAGEDWIQDKASACLTASLLIAMARR